MNWLNSLEVVGVDPPYIHTIIQIHIYIYTLYIYIYITCGILSGKKGIAWLVWAVPNHTLVGAGSLQIFDACAVFVYRIQTTRGAVIANQMTTGSGV